MSLWENVKMAFDSIFAHKLRSFLTMLGIVIGVASVILIVAIGQGGTDQLTEAFAGSENMINLVPKQEQGPLYVPPEETLFTNKDVEDLKRIPEVERVHAYSFQAAAVRHRDKKVDGAFVFGLSDNTSLETGGITVASGRLFHPGEYLSSSGGAILSDVVARKLFPDGKAIGQIIHVRSQPLRVIGVLGRAEGLQGLLETPAVYVPARTWRTVFGKLKIDRLTLQVKNAEGIERAGKEAVRILNRNHGRNDAYEVQNLEQLTQGITRVLSIMTVVIGSIGGISLLVGGIGVMNIMLVSVTERTREIGIRKAMGATRGDILIQFLMEAVTLSVIGGGIGILLGAGGAAILSAAGIWLAVVSPFAAAGGLLFSVLFGIVFGILPANKAARLHPIECLRYE